MEIKLKFNIIITFNKEEKVKNKWNKTKRQGKHKKKVKENEKLIIKKIRLNNKTRKAAKTR